MSSVNNINQVDNSDPFAFLARKESASTSLNDENRMNFLTLLTTQLRNQDPMNPMENAELTSQLAQMSTVDGIERLNKMVSYLLMGQESAESMQAAALVGRGVLVEGKNIALTEAGGIGGFELDAPADRVKLTIKDSAGQVVSTLELEGVEAGSHNYMWDGTTIDGSPAAEGMYSVSIEATLAGEKVEARTLEFGVVTSAIRGASGTDLQVGALGIFKFDDIRQIL